MNNAELFKKIFGIYAEEFWAFPTEKMLDWIASDAPDSYAGKWIPVTEGLPKIDMSYRHHDDYFVQYDDGAMDVASWSNENLFLMNRVTEPYWSCAQFAKVVAWMELPEPWKGELDNE